MEFEMGYQLRNDKFEHKQTDVAIDIYDDKFIISDCEFSKRAEENFGDSDIEWFYEISRSSYQKLKVILNKNMSKMKESDLNEKQRDYYNKIKDIDMKDIMLFLFAYFVDETQAFWLINFFEKNEVEVHKYSF